MAPDALTAFELDALERQKAYRTKRRKWAWSINRPYSEDFERPPPGEIDGPEIVFD